MSLRRAAVIAMLLAGISSLPAGAAESPYPVRPLRLVVPFAAGGGSDIIGRLVGAKLATALGQQVVVDNRPGASANIGAAVVANASPDGHTLLLGNANFTINPGLIRNMPFDPAKDFAPVTVLAKAVNLLAVYPAIPAKSVKELIAVAKAQPGKLNFASPGAGTSSHLGGELFRAMAGIDVVTVHYKGAAPAITDLLGGHVSYTITSTLSVLPHLKSGKLRALGVTGLKRTPAFPEIPTIAEAGLPGYEVTNWYGVLTTAGSPSPIVQRLNQELARIVAMPDVAERFIAQGADPETMSVNAFERYVSDEIAKWRRVIQDAKIPQQ